MFDIVINQIIVMAIFMIAGSVLFKTKIISHEGSKTLTSLLIYFINPVAVIRSFCMECTPQKIKTLGLCFALCALVLIISLLFSHSLFRKKPLQEFAASYPNSGFFGIPLIQAVFGSEAVFYIVPLVFLVGALQYSYGVYLLTGSKKAICIKRILLSPNGVALLIGLFLFLTGLGNRLPAVVTQCINTTANMNTFCAMAVLGIFVVQSDLSQLYKKLDIYLISVLRIMIVPLICTLIFRFIPVDYTMKFAILLAFAGPVGSNVANYSLLYNADYATASLYVAVSTVLCLITLPLFTVIAEKIL